MTDQGRHDHPEGAHDHAGHRHDGAGQGHGHDHGHHGHSHGLGHVHAPADFGTRFKIAIALNLGIVVVQGAYGIIADSVALLADAGHNLSDVLGLVIAYLATVLTARRPSRRYTYGLGQTSILAALFNAGFLLVAVGALSWEAVERFGHPKPVAGGTVMIVAAICMVLNGFTAWLFASGGKADVNIRGAFLHMAADAAVSAGVVLSGLLILLTGWLWIDPLASLVVNVVIVWGTWSLLRQSLALSLGAVPEAIDYAEVRSFLAGRPGVTRLHDLHIWPLSTTDTALTAHLVRPGGGSDDVFLRETASELRVRFAIGHVTLQMEEGDEACELAVAHPA